MARQLVFEEIFDGVGGTGTGGDGGTGGGGIVDVTLLPTENINDNVIYRLERKADIYVKGEDTEAMLKEYIVAENGIKCSISVQIVYGVPLPINMEASVFEDGGTIHVYIDNDTGIAYCKVGNYSKTFAEQLLGTAALNQGWFTGDVDSITNVGVYSIKKKYYTYHIHKDGVWVEVADATKTEQLEAEDKKLADRISAFEQGRVSILLDEESTADDIKNAIDAYRNNSANILWSTNGTDFATLVAIKESSPKTIYFATTTQDHIKITAENDGTISYEFIDIGGSNIDLDTTLSVDGKAADAGAVGLRFTQVDNAIAALGNAGGGSGGASGLNNDGVEIFIIPPGMPPMALGTALITVMSLNCIINTQVVETLPSTLEPSTLENGSTINVYVVESTGIGYCDVGIGAMPLGLIAFEAYGMDKGWSSDVAAEVNPGVYAVRKSDICKGNPIVHLEVQASDATTTLTAADWVKVQGDFFNTSIHLRQFLGAAFAECVLCPSYKELSAYYYGCVFYVHGTWNIASLNIENGVATFRNTAVETV